LVRQLYAAGLLLHESRLGRSIYRRKGESPGAE
jgi:hypothetical protein